MEVSIISKECSVEVSQLAGRLGGICTEETVKPNQFEQKFKFNLESMGEQFQRVAVLFSEVISVGRSPSVIEQAIAASKLCDCGWTTKASCDHECEAAIDQQLELAQEFPTLKQLKGDRHD